MFKKCENNLEDTMSLAIGVLIIQRNIAENTLLSFLWRIKKSNISGHEHRKMFKYEKWFSTLSLFCVLALSQIIQIRHVG